MDIPSCDNSAPDALLTSGLVTTETIYASPNTTPYTIETNTALPSPSVVFTRGKVEFADPTFLPNAAEPEPAIQQADYQNYDDTEELSNAELTARVKSLEKEVALLLSRIIAHNAGSPWRI